MIMLHVLASNILAPLGQAAAIILALYMLVFILIGLGFCLLFMYGLTWVREKAELVKKLRPTVDSVNTTIESGTSETLPATVDQNNKLVQAVHRVQSVQVVQKAKIAQKQVENIGEKVDQGTDRVANTVIEFRARTVMVQGMLKTFFLPGLEGERSRRKSVLLQTALGISAPVTAIKLVGTSGSPGESSNVVIAQPNLPEGLAQPVGAGQLKPLVSAGGERADDAPGS